MILILFPFKNGPSGGGNKFLLNLRQFFRSENLYSNSLAEADSILINSHHLGPCCIYLVFLLFHTLLGKRYFILHRVDGPITLARASTENLIIDRKINMISNILADQTVFQTVWSQFKCYDFGLKPKYNDIVIQNSANPEYFNVAFSSACRNDSDQKKLKIVFASWSDNPQKGYSLLKTLDIKLDFNKFEVYVISPLEINSKNLICLKPLNTKELSKIFRSCDIYLAASFNDPCSNALIEACQSGMYPVVRSSGGHPEIVAQLPHSSFTTDDQAIEIINSLDHDIISHYREQLPERPLFSQQLQMYSSLVRNHKKDQKNIFTTSIKLIHLFIYFNLDKILYVARTRIFFSK